MSINNLYFGREHSLIKHELLRGYLEKLLFIVASGGVREITYVDCFSGPWGDETEDLEGTSISISLKILNKVKSSLQNPPHNKNLNFRAIYVEKDKNSYKKLKAYLDKKCPKGIDCHHLQGDYFDLQDDILRLCDKGFAFFFVDPKGWMDIGITKLEKLLARPDSELLINFMYDFLNRAVGMEIMRDQVSQLIGDLENEEYEILKKMPKSDREEKIVNCYRDRLKELMSVKKGNKARTYYSTILDKDKERTKYHMIYLTGHPKGLIEFSKISENVDVFQKKVRMETRLERKERDTGIVDMFGSGGENPQDSDTINISEVCNYWLEILETGSKTFSDDDLADILEETGWLESDLQKAFGELLEERKVENIDAKGKRKSRFVHFDKRERLRKIK